MPTPFTPYQNCTLIFEVQGSLSPTFDEFGNPVVQTSNSAEFQGKASQKKDPRVSAQQGIDSTQTYMEIRLTEPIALPPEIKAGAIAKMTVAGREGEFQLLPAIPSPYGVDEILGQKLSGYFTENG